MTEWNEKAVFLAALDLAPADREEFLRGACSDPREIERIRALLRHAVRKEDTSEIGPMKPPPEAERPWRDAEEFRSIDEFRIIRTLGEGGMGTVHLAQDTVLDRLVALKVIARHLTLSPKALARFTSEARIAAKLNHPGIVPVHKFGFDGRVHYLVVDYVPGPTLAEVIAGQARKRQEGTTTHDLRQWRRYAIETLAAVADALESAHRLGVVHRDVKPSNILIDPAAGPRLTDFGIAIQLEAEATTRSYEIMGSVHYMSPEQARDAREEVDHRSDLFSLGVILYEMLTHQRPFEGRDLGGVLRAIVNHDPRRPRSIDRKIPRDLEVVTLKCLEKRPAQRYQSAAHLAADLRSVLSGQPILARPPGPLRRAARWVRQRRSLAGAALTLVLVGALALLLVERLHRTQADFGTVSVDVLGAHADAALYASRWNEALRRYERAVPLRFSSARRTRLSPGTYRFHLIDAANRFADFDDLVLAGSHRRFTVRLNEPSASAEGMVRFDPADAPGDLRLGEYADPATGQRRRDLPLNGPFWLDAAEVTNGEYLEFVRATGAAPPFYWEHVEAESIAGLPVVAIPRQAMLEYALWRGKRLPTVYEWLYAVQMPGGENQPLPWGLDPAPQGAIPTLAMIESQYRLELPAQVEAYRAYAHAARSHEALRTPRGLFHMFGNVREMTSTVVATPTGITAVYAGGHWATSPNVFSCMTVGQYPLHMATTTVGFRCARSAAPQIE